MLLGVIGIGSGGGITQWILLGVIAVVVTLLVNRIMPGDRKQKRTK